MKSNLLAAGLFAISFSAAANAQVASSPWSQTQGEAQAHVAFTVPLGHSPRAEGTEPGIELMVRQRVPSGEFAALRRADDERWNERRLEDTDPVRGKRQNLVRIADLSSAEALPGPGHHCVSGVGFRIESDEILHRPWRSLGKSGPVHLEVAGTTITIEDRGGTLSRHNAQNPEEHPLALVQDSRVYFFPGIGVRPREGEDLVREQATWRFDLGVRSHSVALSVSFPASGTSAGLAFLQRLEFAAAGDDRCAGAVQHD